MNTTALRLSALLLVAACGADREPPLVGQLASDRLELDAEFAEPVVARRVVEGQPVSRGDLLVEQDTTRIDARVAEAEASLAEHEARLDELTRGPRREQIEAARASVEGARRDVEFQRLEYRRARDVLQRQLASPAIPRSPSIRRIRAERRRRVIAWSDRFVLFLTTGPPCRDGRVLTHAVIRRHFREKGEDSRASTTRGRAGSARWRPRSAVVGLVSAGLSSLRRSRP